MPDRKAIADFMATMEIAFDRAHRQEADGWVVVVLDTDLNDKIVSAYGTFETPEEALAAAGRLDADPFSGRTPVDGQPGWKHVVVPLFTEEKEE